MYPTFAVCNVADWWLLTNPTNSLCQQEMSLQTALKPLCFMTACCAYLFYWSILLKNLISPVIASFKIAIADAEPSIMRGLSVLFNTS